jgi:hypothetical protein
MTVVSSSSKSYTADGTPVPKVVSQVVPQVRPQSTRSSLSSLPPLVPNTPMSASNLIDSSQSNTRSSSEAPIPMSSTAYHAYFAASDDDDEDYESDDESPPQPMKQDTKVEETKSSDVEDVDKYFKVPQPSIEDKHDNTEDDSNPAQSNSPAGKSIALKPDETEKVAKCENKSLPDTKLPVTDKTTAPNAEVDEPNYYMRVARVLLGILILLVVGYIVYWVLLNVFGIDLWILLCEKLWGKSDVGTTAENLPPMTHETVPVSAEGQQQKQALTDKTAATLLNMMTAIRKHSE